MKSLIIGAAFTTASLVTSFATAQIDIEELGQVKAEQIVRHEYQQLSLKDGRELAISVVAPTQLMAWDLRNGSVVADVSLQLDPPGKWIRLNTVLEVPGGEILAVVDNQLDTFDRVQSHLVLLSQGKSIPVQTGDWGATVVAHFDSKQGPHIGISGAHKEGGQSLFDYHILNAQTGALLAKTTVPFSGNLHLRDSESGIQALIGGYEVVATWNPQTGEVRKVLEREQPSLWPTMVKVGKEEWLHMDGGDGSVLYDGKAIFDGTLVVKKRLPKGQTLQEVQDSTDLLTLEKLGSEGPWTHTGLVLRELKTGKSIGGVAVNFGIGQVKVERDELTGDWIGIVTGRTKPTLFVSPSELLMVNFSQGQVLSRVHFPREIQNARLRTGRPTRLVEVSSNMGDGPTVLEFATGKLIYSGTERESVVPLIRLQNEKLMSIHKNTLMHQICVVDWEALEAESCFENAWDQAFTEASIQAIEEGRPFMLPLTEPVGEFGVKVLGFQLFGLRP